MTGDSACFEDVSCLLSNHVKCEWLWTCLLPCCRFWAVS